MRTEASRAGDGRRGHGAEAKRRPVAGRCRLEPLWLAVGLAGVAAVGYVSLVPLPPGGPDVPQLDKIEHVAAYGALGLWFAALRPGWRWRGGWGAALVAYGALIEVAQGMTGYRTAEIADLAADAAGVGVGLRLTWTRLGALHRWLEGLWAAGAAVGRGPGGRRRGHGREAQSRPNGARPQAGAPTLGSAPCPAPLPGPPPASGGRVREGGRPRHGGR